MKTQKKKIQKFTEKKFMKIETGFVVGVVVVASDLILLKSDR